jgi:geranylgeranyl reductase family protein
MYDVIVAGGGPAGSTAARECAARGLDVLLLDRADFPRDKPCGGAVSLRAARLLPFDLTPVVERVVYEVRLSRGGPKRVFCGRSSEPLALLTRRSRLDAFLVERACAAGATWRPGTALREVECTPGRVVVRAGAACFEARTLVAADGANGPTARLAGLAGGRRLAVAYEGNLAPPGGLPARWEACFGFDAGVLPGGYGWIFPKGDHLNLGLGGWQPLAPLLRDRLEDLACAYGFDPAALVERRGFHLPFRTPEAPLAAGNVLLVGDAAGLVDPFNGEGIYGAFRSGRAAAEAIGAYLGGAAPDLGGYAATLERGLLPELRIAAQLYALFQFNPPLALAALRHAPGGWGLLFRLMRGEETYAGLWRKLGPFGRILDRAARFIG